jgi:hypothetical protein
MAAYAITRYSTGLKNSVDEALEDLETELETQDSTANPIRGIGVEMTGRDQQQCIGWLLYET